MNDKNFFIEEFRNEYQIVREQLIFAESKNAALLAFNIAFITLLLVTDYSNKLFFVACVVLVISSITCLYSFHPLSYEPFRVNKIDGNNESVIYFRNIARYSTEEYVEKVAKQIGIRDANTKKIELAESYAKEIIVIAKITVIKNNVFSIARTITIVSLIIVLIKILVNLFNGGAIA